METDSEIRDTDLEHMLTEADREQRFLVAARRDDGPEPREEIDQQILAGLITPY